jgi:hypothetical protein
MGKEIFWGEMAPCGHEVEFYGNDREFIDRLEAWVRQGLEGGESVVVIATRGHIEELELRLRAQGVDLVGARLQDRYIPLCAERTLARFMRNDWPDDANFVEVVGEVLCRARNGGRKVRAFGEMVAILWARGQTTATVRLEFLWNQLLRTEKFPLFCAYPRAGFLGGPGQALADICALHTRVTGVESAAA